MMCRYDARPCAAASHSHVSVKYNLLRLLRNTILCVTPNFRCRNTNSAYRTKIQRVSTNIQHTAPNILFNAPKFIQCAVPRCFWRA